MHNIPLSLYIHFPWCVKKCPYCDFNSHALLGNLPAQDYVQALINDFTNELDSLCHSREGGNPVTINTIFMGGGTPSLFHAKELEPLFKTILPYCATDVEITLEANPGTIERGQFKDYRTLGINRISLGVQSLNEKHLKKLGRIHNVDEVKKAVTEIHDAGFQHLNLDLMHGLPEQTMEDALSDLEQALALQPSHLSWYQLTIEPNTYFANYPPKLPHDDALADIEEAGFALLAENGFERYEISAFAKNQDYCRHNLNYWQFGDYIGIGAGAHGKLTINGQVVRTTKPKLPKTYLRCHSRESGNPVVGAQMVDPRLRGDDKTVSPSAIPFEFMMNALRLTQGFEKSLFEARTNLLISAISKQINTAKAKGLLIETNTHFKPSDLGLRFLNDLLNEFL